MYDFGHAGVVANLRRVKRLDRRQLLARGALLAASAAGLPRLLQPAAASAAGAAPGLAPARLATFRKLAEALRLAPGRRLAHRDEAAAAAAFAAAYAAGDAALRAHADAVLDEAAGLLRGAGGPAARLSALRPGPGGGSPAPEEAHRRSIVLAAVALVEGPADQREPTEGIA